MHSADPPYDRDWWFACTMQHVHPFDEFWAESQTRVAVLTQKETWQLENDWRRTFALPMLTRAGRWPAFDTPEDLSAMFAHYVVDESSYCKALSAMDQYDNLEASMSYSVLTTRPRVAARKCFGKLPPLTLAEECSQQSGDAFLVSEMSLVWTAVLWFEGKGPYFIWKNSIAQ
jgi:hypothetical protein